MQYIVYVFFKHFILQSIIFNTLIYIQYISLNSHTALLFMTSLAVAMGSIKCILSSDLLLEWKRWTHLACWGLPALIPWRKKITCCRHFKLIVFLDNFGHRIAKSGERGPKQLLWAYCALKTFGFFLHLLK